MTLRNSMKSGQIETDRQTDRQEGRRADGWTGRQADRRTDAYTGYTELLTVLPGQPISAVSPPPVQAPVRGLHVVSAVPEQQPNPSLYRRRTKHYPFPSSTPSSRRKSAGTAVH